MSFVCAQDSVRLLEEPGGLASWDDNIVRAGNCGRDDEAAAVLIVLVKESGVSLKSRKSS